MFGENKNLKDSEGKLTASYATGSQYVSVIKYTKTDKLITALYMVTDIIDKDEPLRNKLRTLGTGIISDIYITPANICSKVLEMMSFLNIASAVGIISEMNCNILKKEFLELDRAIKESTGRTEVLNRQVNLSEFFKEEIPLPNLPLYRGRSKEGVLSLGGRGNSKGQSIGHQYSTRIGVQKGSTLMKALSEKTIGLSNMNVQSKSLDSFDILKKDRRENLKNIIKIVGGSATIKDIKDNIQMKPDQAGALVSCGEKTLQRELVSMVRDGILNKTGEKRWSRYLLR